MFIPHAALQLSLAAAIPSLSDMAHSQHSSMLGALNLSTVQQHGGRGQHAQHIP